MISLIFAMDQNQLIGNNNGLPWRLPADLRYFKQVTGGKIVIMGRKTFESIGKPLPNRTNWILTRDSSFQPEGGKTFASVEEVLAALPPEEEVFVIGGAEVYARFLPVADRLYITRIDHAFAGDAYFPPIDWSEWELFKREEGTVDAQNPYRHTFEVWQRSMSRR